MSNHLNLSWVRCAATMGMLLAAASVMFAQNSTGTILGTVKDASGASVPGAVVTIQNLETTQARTVTTADDGTYRAPALAVGHYTLTFEKAGFNKQMQEGVNLEVGQELVLNPTLGVGTAEQEVTVTAETQVVNTTNSTLGGTVNEDKMSDLPLNGRNFIDLSLMQAGVTLEKSLGAHFGQSGSFVSTNGNSIRSNLATLDGALMMSPQMGVTSSQTGTTLGVDAIREYKVVTGTFGADYPLVGGSQISIVTKSGTNQFHGDVFEYLRNSSLDARNFFDSPSDSGGKRLPEFRRNNFGGGVGGPIRKDKTFFYATYEGFRQYQGFTALNIVPPAACHTLNNIVGNACDSSLAGNATETVPVVIQPILALFPSPQSSNIWSFETADVARVDYGQIRVDQNISTSDTFFARYTIQDAAQVNANTSSTAATATGNAWPFLLNNDIGRDQFLTFSENHIFSPILLNTIRLSGSRTGWNDVLVNPQSTQTPYSLLTNGNVLGGVSITGYTGIGNPTVAYQISNIITFTDDLFYTHGKHALKFGTMINHWASPAQYQSFNTSPSVAFTTLHAMLSTGAFNTVTALAPGSNNYRYYDWATFGFYVQDDWHTTSKLTLNLGLRYEFRTTPVERNNRVYAFQNPNGPPVQGPLISNPTHTDFSPRFGFAYDVTGKGTTAIRGGFGLYDDVLSNIGPDIFWNDYKTPPLVTVSQNNNPTNASLSFPIDVSGVSSSLPITVGTVQYQIPKSYTLQWNLTVERQLPGNTRLTVSYVGTRGVHAWTGMATNGITPTSYVNGVPFWAATDAQGDNLFTCQSVVPSCRHNTAYDSMTVISPNGDSFYHALQVNATKQLGHGLQWQIAYTYSKSIDDTQNTFGSADCADDFKNGASWGEFPDNLKVLDRGPSCFDVTHNLRINLLYHIPNVNVSNRYVAGLLHGWWIGNIVSIQSGYPVSPSVSTTTRARSGTTALRLDTVTATTAGTGGAAGLTFIPFNPKTVITGNPQAWFNPLMFTIAPEGFLGDAQRNDLRAPGSGDWDFSLVKDTSLPLLGEAGSVEFRAEIFNFLNRANFGYPQMTAYAGNCSASSCDAPFSEAPVAGFGQITTTNTTARQIQLALRFIF